MQSGIHPRVPKLLSEPLGKSGFLHFINELASGSESESGECVYDELASVQQPGLPLFLGAKGKSCGKRSTECDGDEKASGFHHPNSR